MLSYLFQCIGTKRKSRAIYTSLFRHSATAIYISILIMVCGFHTVALGQQQLTYPTKNDYIQHTDTGRLDKARINLSVDYKKSVIASSKDAFMSNMVPFYPYVTINLSSAFLPPPPVRIYLGKLTPGNSNDFLVIVVPCKKDVSRYNPRKTYSDILPSESTTLSGPPNNAKWYAVRVSSFTNTTDKVIYQQIKRTEAQQYVNNFDTVTSSKGLRRKFPLYTVIESRVAGKYVNNSSYRIKLQPVIKKPSSSSTTGGTRNATAFNKSFFYDGEDYTLQDAETKCNICCEAPPESGNAISFRHH